MTSSSNIPEAAVEAALRVSGGVVAAIMNEKVMVRRILEAAAPHMLAEAWDEGWRGGYNTQFAKFSLNPYRPAP